MTIGSIVNEANVTASWGPRAETLDQVVARMTTMFELLPNYPAGPWGIGRYTGQTLTLDPVESPEEIRTRIEAATLDAEEDKRPRTVPGHAVFWDKGSAATDRTATLTMFVGKGGALRNPNYILAALDPFVARGVTPEAIMRAYVIAVAQAWNPDYACAWRPKFRDETGVRGRSQAAIGWFTFLSDRLPLDRHLIPESVTVERTRGGLYLTLPGTLADPDLDAALTVRKALGY